MAALQDILTNSYKAVMPTFVKFQDRPEVHAAMRKLWHDVRQGNAREEAVFTIDADGTVHEVPYSNESKTHSLTISKNTVAVFHSHPNTSGGLPSVPDNSVNGLGDTAIADRFKLPIYVVSQCGWHG